RRLEEQLRGPIVALFAPVFFTLAGRSIDLRILGDTRLLALAGGFVAVACAGKLLGGFLGGRLGGLTSREAAAPALGMTARGSTEVVVATIGLTVGILSQPIFTLIVIVAITTTIVTPPILKWLLAGIPARGDERERLEREAAEASQFVPHIERILVVTEHRCGDLAVRLAALFAGARQVTTTILPLGAAGGERPPAAGGRTRRWASRGWSARSRPRRAPSWGTSRRSPGARACRSGRWCARTGCPSRRSCASWPPAATTCSCSGSTCGPGTRCSSARPPPR